MDGLELKREKGFSNVSVLGRRASRREGRPAVEATSSPPNSQGAGAFFLTLGPSVLTLRGSFARLLWSPTSSLSSSAAPPSKDKTGDRSRREFGFRERVRSSVMGTGRIFGMSNPSGSLLVLAFEGAGLRVGLLSASAVEPDRRGDSLLPLEAALTGMGGGFLDELRGGSD